MDSHDHKWEWIYDSVKEHNKLKTLKQGPPGAVVCFML